MKASIAALGVSVLLLSAFAQAAEKSTIEFTLMGEEVKNHDVKPIQLSSLNAKLKAKGLPGFPEIFVAGKTDIKWAQKIRTRVADASKALNRDLYAFSYGGSGLYLHQLPENICYRGKPADVLPIIKALMENDGAFDQDMGIQAVRYGTTVKVLPDYKKDFFGTNASTREEDEENNPSEVKAWDSYKTASDSVLIMSDLGPEGDGTELYSTLIKRCR